LSGIFISYRREDSGGHAGRLFDRLRSHFGNDRVFMDVTRIEPGEDFVEAIDRAVGSCDVLLAVIGRQWLTCTDETGRRRLDNPNDLLRLETATALKRNVRVVPVLTQGAKTPSTEVLPEDLKRLTRRQAVELRDTRWDADIADLIKVLEKILASELPVERAISTAEPTESLAARDKAGVPPSTAMQEAMASPSRHKTKQKKRRSAEMEAKDKAEELSRRKAGEKRQRVLKTGRRNEGESLRATEQHATQSLAQSLERAEKTRHDLFSIHSPIWKIVLIWAVVPLVITWVIYLFWAPDIFPPR
jgi:hypothetical protein